jgi:hypothetical protein
MSTGVVIHQHAASKGDLSGAKKEKTNASRADRRRQEKKSTTRPPVKGGK